ncbi:MAG: sulfotransferase [Actinobacteria bacterium]|nr:sulfotransferase [Actinomycetota bacterium]
MRKTTPSGTGSRIGGAPFSRLFGTLHVDAGNGDHRNSVFLAGSGRSGTTWVSEIINHRNAYRLVFEPFHPGKVGMCESFRRKQYLRPDDRREEYLGPARRILTGGLRNYWTDRFNKKFVARRRLIKDIRANLLLGWISENFPGMPIILLLRHPCAVATSRLALGWRDNLLEMMEQEELVEDFLLPVEAEIRGAQGAFERHLFSWCIENYVPLRQFGPGEIQLSFYENFLAYPEDEIRRLFTFLGEGFDGRVYRALSRPSPLSCGGESPSVDAWRRSVTDSQLERAVEILGLFGLDRVYGEGTMPDPSGAHALMGGARG